ncbi:hypothetical protein H181DRAFT_02288 [Streptomyces sp. WMMB 714]|jgi:hypothetical protein|uniref:hypothetical protein n=1 Tax=Streptomyces sp. WMMB 714 TaxID=1286822 RepID=UPI0005F7B7AC|nr:hypothetical protein [Streptomyces sp. WMMB 714]SCK29184.1 hypothetical protein H181DRAFT_02288 [Streptomyces sp. WMMB 714]
MSKPRQYGARPSTVRPWYTLAALGVLESDLTSTRRYPAPRPRDRAHRHQGGRPAGGAQP